MLAIQYLFNAAIGLYTWVLIGSVIMSWLITFRVINLGNPMVNSIYRGVNQLLEPVLQPIRRFLPDTGGLDLSTLVLFFGLQALQIFVNQYIFRPLVAAGL
ncbi:MAG: YggT family protein [Pseudomonadota bacterium]